MSNTISGSLTTDQLIQMAITPLQNSLAPLRAFTISVPTDPIKPRSTLQIPFVSAGSTTLTITQGASFEAGDATVSNIAVTMAQMSQPFHLNNYDLQGGMRIENLIEINAAKFADSLIDVVLALVTEANFGAPVVTSAAAAFAWGDLPALYAALAKSSKKNLILSSPWMAQLANQPGYFQAVGSGSGGFKVFGWDEVHGCSRFTAAGPNIVGFACHPQALVCAIGLPMVPNGIDQTVFELPGLGIKVAMTRWTQPATRTSWASLDCMIGAAVGDPSSLKLIKGI